jgi:hypothetical protein
LNSKDEKKKKTSTQTPIDSAAASTQVKRPPHERHTEAVSIH